MIKHTVKYNDLDGNPVEEDWHFHFNMDELIDMQLESNIADEWQKLILAIETKAENTTPEQDNANRNQAVKLIRQFILASVGKRSADGRRFEKTPEIQADFRESGAYSAFFINLMEDPKAASTFINNLVDKSQMEKLAAIQKPEDVERADIPEKQEVPAWIRENRAPTDKELMEMPREQLVEAMRRKNAAKK